VVTIWDGFQRFFAERDLPFDYVLYTNYESMVRAHFSGAMHVAWNSPLAWIEAERLAKRTNRQARAVAMRDTDQDLTSVVLARSGGAIKALSDLRGKRIGVGAKDSPQATLIPLSHIAELGLVPGRDFEVVYHDVLVGKHGDHIGGERDAAKALLSSRVDAVCILDANTLGFAKDGTLPPGSTTVVSQTKPYDHCCFTILDGAPEKLLGRFVDLLLAMRFDDPSVRPLMELEGLKAWRRGRTVGFEQLARAVDRFEYLDAWLGETAD
jgi:ABC-type phosphate/phosphonate transport system substrate-binding protein